MVRTILTKSREANGKSLYSQVEGISGIPVKTLMMKEGLNPKFNALYIETEEWVKKIRDDHLISINNSTLRMMKEGLTVPEIVAELAKTQKMSIKKAQMVARQQVASFNGLASKIRAQSLGITEAIWKTGRDGDRVRPSHQDREGKRFKLSEGLYSSLDGKHLQVGTDFNCFVGESKLNHTSFCNIIYRRKYTGHIVTVKLDSGSVLRVTPNHPIFTASGKVSAGLLNVGDNVIKTINKHADASSFYSDDFIPTFDEIFSTLNFLGVDHSISPAISGKFHGDISDGEVNIIDFNSLLMREADASVREKFAELNLTASDEMTVLAFLTCSSEFTLLSERLGSPSVSDVSVLNLIFSSFLRHLRPLELFRFALGAWRDSSVKSVSPNGTSANIEMFRDCIFAFSVLVHGLEFVKRKIDFAIRGERIRFDSKLPKFSTNSGVLDIEDNGDFSERLAVTYQFDSVVNVSVSNFSSHVYNLETVSNDYTASTVVSSNCRCRAHMIIPESE